MHSVAAPLPAPSPRVKTLAETTPRDAAERGSVPTVPPEPRAETRRRRSAVRRGGTVAESLRSLGRGITATHAAEAHIGDIEAEVRRMRVLAVHAKVFVGRSADLQPLDAELSLARQRATSCAEAALFQRHALLGRRQPAMRLMVEDEELTLSFCDASPRGLGLEGPWGLEDPEQVQERVDRALDRLRDGTQRARDHRVELAKRALELVAAEPEEVGGALAWVVQAAQRAVAAVASSGRQRPNLALQLLAG